MCLQDVLPLAQETVPLAKRPALPEVMPTCYGGKLIQLAGIPDANPLAALEIKLNLVFHIETETGWAHVGAGSASKAALPELGPKWAFQAHIEQRGEVAYIKFQAIGEFRPFLTEDCI